MGKTDNPVWFITGCSIGFGRALAKLILDKGWNAVITARNTDQVKDIAEGYDDTALVLTLDVTSNAQITTAVAQAEQRF